jgi:hypothetical protein
LTEDLTAIPPLCRHDSPLYPDGPAATAPGRSLAQIPASISTTPGSGPPGQNMQINVNVNTPFMDRAMGISRSASPSCTTNARAVASSNTITQTYTTLATTSGAVTEGGVGVATADALAAPDVALAPVYTSCSG